MFGRGERAEQGGRGERWSDEGSFLLDFSVICFLENLKNGQKTLLPFLFLVFQKSGEKAFLSSF